MSRKAKTFSYSRFPNKNSLTFSTKIPTAIKTSDEKHQNIIKSSTNSVLDVDINHTFRQYYYVITIMSLLFE